MSSLSDKIGQDINNYLQDFADQTIGIVGLGREGISTYQFLREFAPKTTTFWLVDQKNLNQLPSFWQDEVTQGNALFFSPTENVFPELDKINQLFVSPGISDKNLDSLLFSEDQATRSVNQLDLKITNNLNLTLELCEHLEEIVTIGVTGTKGKSTTTALIAHVVSSFDLPCQLGGNIGTAPLSTLSVLLNDIKAEINPNYLVLEMSSHQLSKVKHSPNLAVVQAVTPEHLDYYDNFDTYLDAKANICRYQTENDVVFYNAESETAHQVAELSAGMQRGFSVETSLLDQSDLKIPGKHNLLNAVPSILVADHLNLDISRARQAVRTFRGLLHRLELVEAATQNEKSSRKWFNDSLATTPEAAIAALESVVSLLTENQKVVFITGGFDRGLSYQDLSKYLAQLADKQLLRAVCYFPDTGSKIVSRVEETDIPTLEVNNMEDAVSQAHQFSRPGDVILMSPASASFNMFKDYADRGDQFKQALQQITANSGSSTT